MKRKGAIKMLEKAKKFYEKHEENIMLGLELLVGACIGGTIMYTVGYYSGAKDSFDCMFETCKNIEKLEKLTK